MWFALLSSISLTLMVILDRLMINDCYNKNVPQAIFVSSFASFTLGILLTGLFWIFGNTSTSELFTILISWFNPYGFLILGAGILSAQVLYHYFYCFSQNGDSTLIAAWLAATPIFVYAGAYVLSLLGILFESVLFTPLMLMAVLLTSISLSLLEYISYESSAVTHNYRKHLIWMLLYNTVYVLIIDQTISHGEAAIGVTTFTFILAFLPLYWFGFLAGTRFMVNASERLAFLKNTRIYSYVGALLVIELLGMLVFFFEFLGLGSLNSVAVAIIISLHVLPVWLLSVLITNYGVSMQARGVTKTSFLTIPLNQTTLEEFATKTNNRSLQFTLVIITLIGVALFLLLI